MLGEWHQYVATLVYRWQLPLSKFRKQRLPGQTASMSGLGSARTLAEQPNRAKVFSIGIQYILSTESQVQ